MVSEIAPGAKAHLYAAGVKPNCHWVYRRKRAVVEAIQWWPDQRAAILGWLEIADEEADGWVRRYAEQGDDGLMATNR